MTPRTLRIERSGRPVCVNAERKMAPRARAEFVREWRYGFGWLVRATPPVRPFDRVRITVEHHRPDRRSMPDVAGCAPTAKAAIDGLVDAGLLAGDGPDHVRALTFEAPIVSGRHALALVLVEVDA